MNKATLYITILAVVCICLGTALGAVVERKYVEKNLPKLIRQQLLELRSEKGFMPQGHKFSQGERWGKKGEMGERIIERLNQELNLTPEQGGQVKAILEATKGKVEQTQTQFRQSLKTLKEESHAQISTLLNDEQKAKFEEWVSKAEQRREKWTPQEEQEPPYPRE